MKGLIAISILLTSALAEPPVDNRYLPPNHGFNGGGFPPPSEAYGPPGFGSPGRPVPEIRQPSSSYGAPVNSRRPSNQYIPPARRPSSEYGPPASRGVARPSGRFGQSPGPEYGPPNPSQEYGAPNSGFGGDQQYAQNGGYNNLDQSRKYLPPGGRNSNGDDENSQPANYNFEYAVKDDASGNDFGHRESRMGDRAEGVYYVLLPDGRKQIVEYEADQDGYRPKISYEDVGSAGGYNRGLNNGDQGYQEGY